MEILWARKVADIPSVGRISNPPDEQDGLEIRPTKQWSQHAWIFNRYGK
jgi:hypothetical protein